MYFVVGSGPSGAACASSLLKLGKPVTMLDVGFRLEASREQMVTKLADTPFEKWDDDLLAPLTQTEAATSGIPEKRLYGSSYPYRSAGEAIYEENPNIVMHISYALGGFSTVWGAGLLPYDAIEMKGWPISLTEMEPYYRQILEYVPVAAIKDNLNHDYPLYTNSFQNLEPTIQAKQLLATFDVNQSQLSSQGFNWGQARLAVNAPDCIYCGLCMYGCPHRLIYSSSQTILSLMDDPNFRYISNVKVESFVETEASVSITASDINTGELHHFNGKRLFIGAGSFATAKIMLESLNMYNRSITLLDSQYYLVPLLAYKSASGIMNLPHHTLAQIFLKINNLDVSPRRVHLSLYTYNDLYKKALSNMFASIYPAVKPFAHIGLERLLIIQGYLHSDQSPRAALKLVRGNGHSVLQSAKIENADTSSEVRRVIRHLWKNQLHLGFAPVIPMLHIGKIGEGHHSGGTFPMSDDPKGLESDRWGRIPDLKRVHLIDSSTFPHIAATSITFTIMANAARIATETIEHLEI